MLAFEENNNCVSVRIYVKYGGKCRKAKIEMFAKIMKTMI